MSDGLTRYRVRPMLDPDHPWSPSAELVKDSEGGLVYAEEAEARIRELEAERDPIKELGDPQRASNEELRTEIAARIKELEAERDRIREARTQVQPGPTPDK